MGKAFAIFDSFGFFFKINDGNEIWEQKTHTLPKQNKILSWWGTSETQMKNVNYKWREGIETGTWGAGQGRGRGGEGLIWNSQDNSLGRG